MVTNIYDSECAENCLRPFSKMLKQQCHFYFGNPNGCDGIYNEVESYFKEHLLSQYGK